jgi:hypothetical protein
LASLEGNSFVELTDEQLEELVDEIFFRYKREGEEEWTIDDFAKMVHECPGILDCFEFDVGTILT